MSGESVVRQRKNCQTCSVCHCFDHFFSLTHLLKEVDELAHVALVAGGAEDVLLEGALLVQLEQMILIEKMGVILE